MIKKYIQDAIVCIKSIGIAYPVFIAFFVLEVLFEILGVNQYRLISLARFIIDSSGNTNIESLVVKLLISILASIVAYISINYWACRNLYEQSHISVSYRKLFRALWFKFIVIMAVVLVPLRLIVEVVNSNTKIQGFMGYSFVFIFVVLKSIMFFFILGFITKKSVTDESKLERTKYGSVKGLFAKIGLFLICIMVVATPISYYLSRLEYHLFTDNNDILTVVTFINIAFKAFYNAFIYLYVTISIIGKTQKVAQLRSNL